MMLLLIAGVGVLFGGFVYVIVIGLVEVRVVYVLRN